ncbi:MAG TPA: hypothetical protein DEA32_00060 [Firmicutes bacterium]|nr:hypothetical protein [Bacillota bacterium]
MAKKFLTLGVVSLLSILTLFGCQGGTSSSTGGSGVSGSGDSSSTASSSGPVTAANGAKNYLARSYAERGKILGQLESYAMKYHLTGIPMFDDGGSVVYSSRLSFPTENYVTGYGWGLTREGKITAPIKKDDDDKVGKFKNYLHQYQDENPTTLNGLDSQDSVGSTYDGYAHAGLFGNRLKKDANGKYLESYEWYGILAEPNPEEGDYKGKLVTPVGGVIKGGEGDQDLATTFRVFLRKGLKYRTLSSTYKEFDNTEIKPEDYETNMRILLAGDINYCRASQYIETNPIVGAANYFSACQTYGWLSTQAEEAWKKVGYKVGKDEQGNDYLDVTFVTPTNEFYGMYNLTSFNTPIPLEFFKKVTGIRNNDSASGDYKAYGNISGNLTPVDTYLSVGPYIIETWNTTNGIFTFKRNDDWWEYKDDGAYQIEGIKYKTDSGIKSNTEAYAQHFLNGESDSASVTESKYDLFKNHTSQDGVSWTFKNVPGSTNWKWNVNSTTEEEWEKLGGINGTITQTAKKDYWPIKPVMSNSDFLNGVYFATDRKTLANKQHTNPAYEYFSDDYLIDPEQGISYNSTEAHKKVMSNYSPETYGYNKSVAQALFTKAVDSLVAAGSYKDGDKIVVTCFQMLSSEIDAWGKLWENEVEDAFNTSSGAKEHNITLDIQQEAVTSQMDVYYKHLMVGQFDFSMGSISGNTLDPVNFFEVLKSDNSSGFTLNWGTDTSVPSTDLVYDGSYWSFDSLFDAANSGVLVQDGKVAVPYMYKEDPDFGNGVALGTKTTVSVKGKDDKEIDYDAISISFQVNVDLAKSAGIDLTPVDGQGFQGLEGVSISANVYDPDSTTVIDNTTITSYSLSGSADGIVFDASTNTLTITFAPLLNADASAYEDAEKQAAYLQGLNDAFMNPTADNPVFVTIGFTSAMTINDIPCTGSSSTTFKIAKIA